MGGYSGIGEVLVRFRDGSELLVRADHTDQAGASLSVGSRTSWPGATAPGVAVWTVMAFAREAGRLQRRQVAGAPRD